jgi:putative phage-type endonuclease
MDNSLIQGTPEWLDMRRNFIGASDAPIIMGVSPYSTPYKLWEDKLGISPPIKENVAMKRGNELEPIARALLEEQFSMQITPKVVHCKDNSFMMCSLDGLSDDGKTAFEIKYASKDKHELAKDGEIPELYYPQLQHQLACTGLDSIWYCSFNGDEIVNVEVDRDDSYIDDMLAKEAKFWECVKTFTPPELTNKDYVEKDDSLWNSYANRLKEIDVLLKDLSIEKDFIRQTLIDEAKGKSSKGCGISLSKSFVKGRVNYDEIPELADVDLEKYRSASKESWTLRFSKS